MCGIVGIISKNPSSISIDKLKKMTDTIEHRGPDGQGHWINDEARVGFGHRRLSIIDLSERGAQPMHYQTNFTITYNGEIYNYLELKNELLKQGHSFLSDTDTEVLLALYAEYGEAFLEKVDGMYAFAIYNHKDQTVFCARDRFGEKPFYYHTDAEGNFYFGSEMKCLWAAGVPKIVNENLLSYYLETGGVFNQNDISETFYENIKKLPPAHSIRIGQNGQFTIRKYWDLPLGAKIEINADDAAEKFRYLFSTSVKHRLRSDVAVGSSLSGGLDSSLVVLVANQILGNQSHQQSTFSARFPGFAKDEGEYIEEVLKKANVVNHKIYPDGEGMISELSKLMHHQEEPFGSASIYAQYCVYRRARQENVPVILDGQGADELLAGYIPYLNVYLEELFLSKKYIEEIKAIKKVHGIDNKVLERGRVIKNIPGSRAIYNQVRKYTNQKSSLLSESAVTSFEKYQNKLSTGTLNAYLKNEMLGGPLERLLQYADRNAMAHSVEVRLPFLSKDLVEFVHALSPHHKIYQGWTKYIMRNSYGDVLPKKIQWRVSKIGYEPPQNSWLNEGAGLELVKNSLAGLQKKGIVSEKYNLNIPKEDTIYNAQNWKLIMANSIMTNK